MIHRFVHLIVTAFHCHCCFAVVTLQTTCQWASLCL